MSFGSFWKKNKGYEKLGNVTQQTASQKAETVNYMNCADKPTLTLQESMDTIYQPSQGKVESHKAGFNKFTTLFDHVYETIVNEIQERKTNTTPEVKFNPVQLTSLLEKLDALHKNSDAHSDTDIKALIRSHLNEQELDAADPKKNGGNTMGQCVLWDDIRRSLNEQIGFQGALARNPETVVLLTIKSPIPTSKSREQIEHLRESTLQGPDSHASGRIRDYIKHYESDVQHLIDESKKPATLKNVTPTNTSSKM